MSYVKTLCPYEGASLTRTARGITVVKTSFGKCDRTVFATSCANRVRPSNSFLLIVLNIFDIQLVHLQFLAKLNV